MSYLGGANYPVPSQRVTSTMCHIPRLDRSEIELKTEELLGECWDGKFPIDIEKICDYLKISIVPVAGLSEKFGMDAFIAASFTTIYVDFDEFRAESNRYRFSIAHEIGHFVLHREYFPSRVESFTEWAGSVINDLCGYVESQANCFAGCLLVPEGEIMRILNAEYEKSFVRNYYKMERSKYVEVLAKMRQWFMVSGQVVARRMRNVVYGLTT